MPNKNALQPSIKFTRNNPEAGAPGRKPDVKTVDERVVFRFKDKLTKLQPFSLNIDGTGLRTTRGDAEGKTGNGGMSTTCQAC